MPDKDPAMFVQFFLREGEAARLEAIANRLHLSRVDWVKEICRRAVRRGDDYQGDALGRTAPREGEWQRIQWKVPADEGAAIRALAQKAGPVPLTSWVRACVMSEVVRAEGDVQV